MCNTKSEPKSQLWTSVDTDVSTLVQGLEQIYLSGGDAGGGGGAVGLEWGYR